MTGKITHWETDGILVGVTVEGEGQERTVSIAVYEWAQLLDARGGLANVVGQDAEVRGAGAAASIVFLDEAN